MRTTFFALLTAVLAAVVTAERAPAPGTRFLRDDQNRQNGHQVTRQELSARANHPDLFEKRQATTSDAPIGCNAVLNQVSRRRNLIDVGNILTAEETAAFLLGRGSFTWSVLYDESLSPPLSRAPGLVSAEC
jgi:hypothetical protein